MNKYFTPNDKLATLSLFGLGTYNGARGFFWVLSQEVVVHDSKFYVALNEFMPIWIWGVILMIFGLCLIISSVLYSRTDISNKSYYLMTIGGFGCGVMQFLMASASLYNAINWLTPINFTILAAWCGFVGYIGVLGVNDKQRFSKD